METSQSSHANSNNFGATTLNLGGKTVAESVGGRKSEPVVVASTTANNTNLESVEVAVIGTPTTFATATLGVTVANVIATDDEETTDDDSSYLSSEDEDYEEESDDEEEEEDEEWEERLRILEDARRLKQVATWFLHPEKQVQADANATARCFFDRASARERISVEEMEEQNAIMKDMQALKKRANDFMHPEEPVVCEDATLFGRNYYGRASAPEQEDQEEVEERARILEDAKKLKKVAVDYLHPEKPVVCEDASLFGRNYFNRASAAEQEDEDDMEERDAIMADLKQLKKLAVDYKHPEKPVVCEDATLFGRNYFNRASAPNQEDEDDMEERDAIMADLKQLKRLAADYQHPEKPVVCEDPALFGRNYFNRASAPEQEDDAEERALVLEEAKQLKKLATDYLHPERPVVCEDATLFGRNFFGRASAPEQEDEDNMEERAKILKEAVQLKLLAVDYLHPERPVACEDPTMFGRNYFQRASAPEQEDEDYAEERDLVLEDLKQLKKLAVDYLHPERPVACEDPTLFGRNYFQRASAPDQDEDDAEEREKILEDAAQLKKLAVDFMHPERPVTCEDPTLFGRNYYQRLSAPEQEGEEDAEERAKILEEVAQLKKLAVDYKHPERPVVTDPAAFGRNYFNRASAPDQMEAEEAEERAVVLEEAKLLKSYAVDYMHPELPVVTSDPTVFGRNYFNRPSAPEAESDEDYEERAKILEEAKQLKKLALDYLHPEVPVTTTDATACGRNYFDRPSAPFHDQMVHSFPVHEDEIHHEEHHGEHHDGHMETFGFDEDIEHMFDDMRQGLVLPAEGAKVKTAANGEEEEEGKLSRSPSSVMLFTGESVYD